MPTVVKQRDMMSGLTYKVYGLIKFSSSETYTTGGMLLSFGQSGIKATRKPIVVWIQGLSGFGYVYVPQTSALDGGIKVYGTGSANKAAATEIDAVAIPAAIYNDTINFEAVFPGMM